MRHWLILTTVDVLASPNNREHHLIEHLSNRFETVNVVYRRRTTAGSLADRLKDAVWPYCVREEKGNIRYIAVNHPLNHPVGMVRTATATPGAGSNLLRGLALAAGPAGIVKDVATIGSLAGFAMRHGHRGRDVFCTAMGPWAAAAARMLRSTGMVGGVLYEDRDYEPGFMPDGVRRRWTRWLENSSIRSSDGYVAIGERLARLRGEECGRSATVIPTGVRQSAATPRPSAHRSLTIAYVGNIADWACLDTAVRALAVARPRIPRIRLEILGNGLGEAAASIVSLARDLKVADAVTIHPPRPNSEVAAFLSTAAVGYAVFKRVPLRIYAAPLKVLEYMAAGLPVLATAGTEAGDLVLKHNAGLSIEPTVEAVAASLLKLLDDTGPADGLSLNGWLASADFQWPALMEREWQAMRAAADHATGRRRQ